MDKSVVKRLGDLVNIKTGKLDANASAENGEYPFFTCSITPLKINSYSYDCECVLVAGNGDLNVKYYNGKFDAYQRTYIIESKDKEYLNTKYLYYFMSKYIEILRNQSIGGVIKYIKLGNLTDARIPVPSLKEQLKVVEILDKAKKELDKRKEAIDLLDELVKSKFIEMFGDPAFNPKEWNIKSFDEVFNISSSSRILKSEWKTEGTIPFYRVRDMVFLSENGVANNEFFVSEEFYESLQNEKGTPQYGDIMVSATSTIGKCYIVKPGEKFYYKDADILRFRKKVELAPEYFIHFMKTSFAVNQIERTFGITTVPHFTIVNSKKINMIYPPIELQNQFADFVKQVDKLKFKMEESLKALENNFNSLMQKAFEGELRL